MGRFAEEWEPAQKEAVGRAMLQEPGKLTARQAVDALMAGALNCPIPNKRMPHSTAYDCRDKERKRQWGLARSPLSKLPLDQARATLRERLITLVENDLTRLENEVVRGKADRRDIALMVRTLRELEALKGTQHKRETKDQPTEPSPTAKLLAAAQDTTATDTTQPAEQGNSTTTQPAVPAQQSGSVARGHDRSPAAVG